MTSPPQPVRARSNSRLTYLRRLQRDPAAYRRHAAEGAIWLEGEHLLRACLARGGTLRTVLVSASAWAWPALRRLAQQGVEVLQLDDALFGELSALQPAVAVGAFVDRPPPLPLRRDVDTLVLDRIQDAGNAGSMLRSAAALGVAQVLALPGSAALWSPKVLRAGMGAHFALALHEAVAEEALLALGLPLVGTSSHAGDPLPAAALPRPCAWIFGHEGQGVAPRLLECCTAVVAIPQPGGEESLNVAAATAICLYESLRRRLQAR